jgi:phenylacetate-coenzyme A ligase PaaK-like adenylate-forming protein
MTETEDMTLTFTPPGIRQAVAALVAQHSRTFPWYRDLLRARGLSTTAELTDLPVIDEQMLDEHYYDVERPDLADAAVYRTSGTVSGRRKRILFAPADEHDYVAHRRALFREFLNGVQPGAVAVADLGTGHAAATARRIFEELGLRAHDIDFTAPVAEHVARLNEWQPAVLFTMPMIMDRLLNAPDPLTIRPRKTMVLGDLAPLTWRRHVAARFGLSDRDVLDVVGSIEVGAIAYHCADTGLYHFHGHILPEVHRPADLYADCPHDLPGAGPGDGILVLTSLARRYFPAVRFATNDVVRGLRRIEYGGRPVYAFDRIDGRFGGEVKHGERISSHDLLTAVNAACPGALFDVRNDNRLEIRVATATLCGDQVDLIKRSIRRTCPDVARMIDSGLVGDITVTRLDPSDLTVASAKRTFTLKAV